MKRRIIELTEEEITVLESGYKTGDTARYRQRCHIIILKSKGRTGKDISSIVGVSKKTVYHWLDRYDAEGITGLQTKQGQGRKPILEHEEQEIIKQTIQSERQRLTFAHAELQDKLGKEFSQSTLKRFLKNLAVATNE